MAGSVQRVGLIVAAALAVGGIAYAALGRGEAPQQPPAEPAAAQAHSGGEAAPVAAQPGSAEEAQGWADAFTQLVVQVKAEQPDYAAAIALYRERLQGMVRAMDTAGGTAFDQHVSAALEAAAQGTLEPAVAAQIVDKVLQAALHAQIKHELRQALDAWGDAAAVAQRVARAEALYGALRGTLEKREQAYGIELRSRVQAAFDQMRAAADAGNRLDFALGLQLLDKTLMKTFYLAAGGDPHGYAFKARASADQGDAAKARKEQAEGWGFYQALYGYLKGHDAEAAEAILTAFDLQATAPQALDPRRVNALFVQAFLETAADEFAEAREAWGQDEAVIKAYEGALFVDLVGLDLARILGQEAAAQLTADAEAAFQAARAGDRATFEAKAGAVLAVLDQAQAALGLK